MECLIGYLTSWMLFICTLCNTENPPKVFCDYETEKIFLSSDSISLHCTFNSRAEIFHRWTKNGAEINMVDGKKVSSDLNSGILIMNSLSHVDEGRYRCYVNSSFGVSMSNDIILLQAFHQNFNRTKSLQTYVPEVGSPYIMSCQPPASLPTARIYWALESDRLPEEFVDTKRIDIDFHGNLYFSNVILSDGKKLKYMCMTYNEHLGSHNTDDGRYLSPLPAPYGSFKPSTLMWSSSTNDTALFGFNKTLKCIFGGLPTPDVYWSSTSQSKRFLFSPSFNPPRISEGNELRIVNVDFEDGGVYECRAENSGGASSHFIHLSVHAKPKWGNSGQPTEVIEIDVDSNVTINCDVFALPPPTFQWFINGKHIESHGDRRKRIKTEGGDITIENATLHENVIIQCLASNNYGSLIANIALVVQERPPSFLSHPKNKKALIGQQVTFQCKAKGSPRPYISWFKSESRIIIINGRKYKLHPTGDLDILDVDRGDEGRYYCNATNRLTSIQTSATLTVREHPKAVKELTLVLVSVGERVVIPCNMLFDPAEETTVVWLKNDNKVDFNGTNVVLLGRNVAINQVVEDVVGEYSCKMLWEDSEIGQSGVSRVVLKKVPGAAINFSLDDCFSDSRVVKLTWVVGSDNYDNITSCHIYKMVALPDFPQYKDTKIQNIHPRNNVNNIIETSDGVFKIIQTTVLERKQLYKPGDTIRENVDVRPWTIYLFKVACLNGKGPSEPTKLIACKTSASLPARNPSNVCVRLGWSNQLVVVWEPLSQEERNGGEFHYIVSYRAEHSTSLFENVSVDGFNQSEVTIYNQQPFTKYVIFVQSANQKGRLDAPLNYIFGYSGEKVPRTSPTEFQVSWSNLSHVLFAWNSLGEDELGTFIRGYQLKIWEASNPDEFVLRNLTLNQTSPQCGSQTNHGLLFKLLRNTEVKFLVDIIWTARELSAAVCYLTATHQGPFGSSLSFLSPASIPPTGLHVNELGSNHALLVWRCVVPVGSNKYSHKFLLKGNHYNNEAVSDLQVMFIRANMSCEYLIKLRNLLPLRKYFIHVTNIGENDGGSQAFIEFNTRSFSVPGIPYIKDVGVGDGKKIIVSWFPSSSSSSSSYTSSTSTSNPASNYCLQIKKDGTKEEWMDDEDCKLLSQENCNHTKNKENPEVTDFIEIIKCGQLERRERRERTIEGLQEGAYLVRICGFVLMHRCLLSQVFSSPFRFTVGPTKEPMQQQRQDNDKTVMWLIVAVVVLVIFIVVFIVVFIFIISWRGRAYSVRRRERNVIKKSKMSNKLNHDDANLPLHGIDGECVTVHGDNENSDVAEHNTMEYFADSSRTDPYNGFNRKEKETLSISTTLV